MLPSSRLFARFSSSAYAFLWQYHSRSLDQYPHFPQDTRVPWLTAASVQSGQSTTKT
uniref:Uncharacterized protein n=1 Tax=Rhizophora mucronata TaxID=61149 RepID=A0A2P2PKI0_RHIMU